MISLPDMVDLHSDSIQVGRLKLTSYGQKPNMSGEIYTVTCADDNSIV